VLEKSFADVSFLLGMLLSKFLYQLGYFAGPSSVLRMLELTRVYW